VQTVQEFYAHLLRLPDASLECDAFPVLVPDHRGLPFQELHAIPGEFTQRHREVFRLGRRSCRRSKASTCMGERLRYETLASVALARRFACDFHESLARCHRRIHLRSFVAPCDLLAAIPRTASGRGTDRLVVDCARPRPSRR